MSVNKMKVHEQRYLTNGVYLAYTGYSYILTTGTHLQHQADNIIHLDEMCVARLLEAMGAVPGPPVTRHATKRKGDD